MAPSARSAVVLVFDRLNAGFLGPYGNTWVDTPGANRLAADSLLWEHVLADSPSLERLCRSYWTGTHAAQPGLNSPRATLLELLSAHHRRAELITDDPQVAQCADAQRFHDRLLLDQDSNESEAVAADDTQIGRVLAAAFDHWHRPDFPALLWCHCRAFAGVWDAPWELRASLADEEDPPPPRWLTPPERRLAEDYDPDELLGVVQAYAGQILAWDRCLDAWLDAFCDLADQRETLLVVTGARGFPLGEHRRIGPCDEALYGELLQIPLFVRLPQCEGRLLRSQDLVQPPDLAATLGAWFDLPPERSVDGPGLPTGWGRGLMGNTAERDGLPREIAVAVSARERAIRTPAWFLRESPLGPELFVKPDDRWEANEVGDRCRDVVEQLHHLLDLAATQTRESLPALSEVLRDGVE